MSGKVNETSIGLVMDGRGRRMIEYRVGNGWEGEVNDRVAGW